MVAGWEERDSDDGPRGPSPEKEAAVMRRLLAVLGAVATVSSVCATKNFVNQRVGEVNEGVAAVC